ncbi:hypothetical protein N657DRAFT_651575 [Parathielavia appendiculata]|uniref:Uncharacterized protein n=1 Tax=Parathielavia appendiculata TaxID=2587402 RepID=A0AAN6YYA3_9PEZI|nr:hypothetical protein N657DRAFT_651575 [Parathielavia appendiculata]
MALASPAHCAHLFVMIKSDNTLIPMDLRNLVLRPCLVHLGMSILSVAHVPELYEGGLNRAPSL